MFRFFQSPPSDPVVAEYWKGCRKSFSRRAKVEDSHLVVLDAETTGLDRAKDQLLSLATVAVDRGEMVIGSFREWTIYQPETEWNQAIEVHGILPSKTAEGRPESEVIRECLPLFGSHLLVGHHIGFDLCLLNRAMREHCGVKLRNWSLDTAHLAMQELTAFRRTGYSNQRPPSLEEVCMQLGIEVVDRHTAAGDTFLTAQILIVLCADLRSRLRRPLRLSDLPIRRPRR
ncbi:3'-5' exonuclease [Puniceicoccus vermicola]|uniref:3'-5' exonuclease n=1 Tax=Puniceicoccus vermicola TaxID=388746 RepID=A0A7X1E658_9BACT|nr:3'-5' exonuclease [Puniceicoccus vermicola]MBC2603768.1 3'-5' exonuclease [Puniceicoccus vermicola]